MFIDADTAIGSTMCGHPVWTKCHRQPHFHSWLQPLSVMEGKRSNGRLLAASSQMAAGTAIRLADNQRTSKLRRALKPISVQSQEAKGIEQRKEAAIGKDRGSQKSQQAWKWAALALYFDSAHFALIFFLTYSHPPLFIFLFNLFSFFLLLLCICHYSATVKAVVCWHILSPARNGTIMWWSLLKMFDPPSQVISFFVNCFRSVTFWEILYSVWEIMFTRQ